MAIVNVLKSMATVAVIAAASAVPAAAAVTPKDMQIIGRMLGFFDPPFSGQVQVGIVHGPATKVAAEALAQQMGAGLVTGGITLVPKLIADADVAAAGVSVLLLTDVASQGEAAVKAAAGKRVVVVATEPGCADTGRCIVSLQSDPKVEITMNKAAADMAGVKVGAAFRMMIKER